MNPLMFHDVERDAMRYSRALEFLTELRKAMKDRKISFDDAKLLRQQALDGDISGAKRMLKRVIEESY